MPPTAPPRNRRKVLDVEDLRHMEVGTTEELAAWVNANRAVLHSHSLEIMAQASQIHETAVHLRKQLLRKLRHGGHRELGVRGTVSHNHQVRLTLRPLFRSARAVAAAGDGVQMSGGHLVRWYHAYLLAFHQLVKPVRGERGGGGERI